MINKTLITLLTLVVSSSFATAHCGLVNDSSKSLKVVPARDILPENSIGVVYLDSSDETYYSLTIRFPNHVRSENWNRLESQSKNKDFSISPRDIILFDEKGRLGTLKNISKCTAMFWCENDGGTDYDPTFTLKMRKNECVRKLTFKNEEILGNIVAFAVINFNPNVFSSFNLDTSQEDSSIVMRGRLSEDYSLYYAPLLPEIYKHYDRNVQIRYFEDTSNDGYCILLEPYNHRRHYELGCCGP